MDFIYLKNWREKGQFLSGRMNEEKNHLYQLILRQLVKDGYNRAAECLSDSALLPLERVVSQEDEIDLEAIVHHHHLTHVAAQHHQNSTGSLSSALLADPDALISSSLDFSASASDRVRKPAPGARFSTRLPGGHAVGCFNWDGSVFAAGVADGTIKVMDAKQAYRADLGEETLAPVVLKSLFDHTEAVTGLAFHARSKVLLSCSKVNKKCALFYLKKKKKKKKKMYCSLGQDDSNVCFQFHVDQIF